MANWIPQNKITGVKYPPVDDAGKAAYENDPQTKGKYRFLVTDNEPEKIIKALSKKPEKITPVGVTIPEETEQ